MILLSLAVGGSLNKTKMSAIHNKIPLAPVEKK
jgi:hypothetical protein